MIRVAEYLHKSGYKIELRSHSGSPLLDHARQLGVPAKVLPLRQRRTVDLFRLIEGMVGLVRQVLTEERVVLWVLEGTEHTLCAILRWICPPFRRKSLLVRLRLSDRITKRVAFGEAMVMGDSDLVVFPSAVAANRYFESRQQLRLQLGERVFIQHFCKDFKIDFVALETDASNRRHHYFRSDERLPALIEPQNFVWVSVARFDPVKGLEGLIRSFLALDLNRERRPHSLVLIGRSENIKASDLASCAESNICDAVVEQRDSIWSVSSRDLKKQILIVDQRVTDLPQFLSESDAAVISSIGSEVICRTATEFLQVGIPVVSTTVGSLTETLSSQAFYATDEDNLKEAMGDAMAELSNPISRKERWLRSLERGNQLRLGGFKALYERVINCVNER